MELTINTVEVTGTYGLSAQLEPGSTTVELHSDPQMQRMDLYVGSSDPTAVAAVVNELLWARHFSKASSGQD